MKYLMLLIGVFLYSYVGHIEEIKGKVFIIRNNQVYKAHLKSLLDVNDTVVTKESSKAKIVFKDNTIITIGQNSVFKVKDYFFSNKNKSARFSFLKGTFVSVTGEIGKIAPKRFKLETKNAMVGIRGTIVFGKLYEGGDIIGCSSGVIDVIKNGRSVVLKEGEMVGVFGNTITPIFKVPYGYLKHIFAALSLNKLEIKNWFGGIFSYKNKKMLKSSNKSVFQSEWKNYKIENLEKPLKKHFYPLIFDNNLFFEELKYK